MAERHGVPCELVERRSYGRDFDRDGYTAELVGVLTGLGRRPGRHGRVRHDPRQGDVRRRSPGTSSTPIPPLLPSFPGWHGVEDALAYGVKVTGCTVHVATEEVDAGPILAQEAVTVAPDDTVESLHERIKAVERRIYIRTISEILEKEQCPVRALLSVYDKAGVVELAPGLHELGWDLVSSGGTARVIAEAGIPVTDVADLTGFPAILGHRVVTLHPKVHGGILADPTNPEHVADMEAYGIEAIDLVVANLYPFSAEPSIELIDIGGPAMVRAAAKNHAHVGIVTDPSRYDEVLDELRTDGALSRDTRRRLARDAFAHTAAYDAEILAWFDAGMPAPGEAAADDADAPAELPATIELTLDRAQVLRYGENPHQVGARYATARRAGLVGHAVQHGGKDMSYLNVYDTEAAWQLAHSLGEGPRRWSSSTPTRAARRWPTTSSPPTRGPTSATRCRPSAASSPSTGRSPWRWPRPSSRCSPRCVIAPAYDADALALLQAKKNLRILEAQRPGDARARRCARSTAASSCRPPTTSPSTGRLAGRHRAPAHRGRVGRPRAGVAGRRQGHLELHRAGEGRHGRRHRLPASRTAATPAASPREKAAGRARAGRTPPTPSSRSPTDSRAPSRPAPPPWSSPVARSATTRSSPRPTRPASPWSSPASATSATDPAARPDGSGRPVRNEPRGVRRGLARRAPSRVRASHGVRGPVVAHDLEGPLGLPHRRTRREPRHVGLEVEHGRAVDGVEAPDVHVEPVDRDDLGRRDPEAVGRTRPRWAKIPTSASRGCPGADGRRARSRPGRAGGSR